MKKFVCFLILFLFVGTVGCKTQYFLITGINLSSVEAYTYDKHLSYRPVTEFKDKIIFKVNKETEYQYTAEEMSLNTGARCYATSLGYTEDNHLLQETFSMTIDKAFSYTGERIEPGINILQYPAFLEEIEIIEPEFYRVLYYIIQFSDEFVQKASFNDEPYSVTFSCRTSDDLYLQDETVVKFPV